MGDRWRVWLFLIAICTVLALYDLYVIVINDRVYMVDDDCTVLRPITITHENILFYFHRNATMMFCSLVIITSTYRNKEFFFCLYCSKICYNCILLSGKQPQVYCAAHISSHTHTIICKFDNYKKI